MITTRNLPLTEPPNWLQREHKLNNPILCKTCNGTTFVLDFNTKDKQYPFGHPRPCPTCSTPQENTGNDLTRLTQQERAYTWDNLIYDPTNRAAILGLSTQTNGIVYVHGVFGAGKSRLAITAINHARKRGRSTCYTKTSTLADWLKEAIPSEGQMRTRLNQIAAIDVLALDDFDKFTGSSYMQTLIDELIDLRYRHAATQLTIIASKLPPEACDPYVASRFGDNAITTVIALADSSWREITSWVPD